MTRVRQGTPALFPCARLYREVLLQAANGTVRLVSSRIRNRVTLRDEPADPATRFEGIEPSSLRAHVRDLPTALQTRPPHQVTAMRHATHQRPRPPMDVSRSRKGPRLHSSRGVPDVRRPRSLDTAEQRLFGWRQCLWRRIAR
jgi:hypothetical protein